MKLENVPAGFQDRYVGTANEKFERPRIENIVGDGAPSVTQTGDKTLELVVPAGTVGGNTAFDLVIDGHVGDGDADIVTQIDYDTVAPDATTVGFEKVGREPIPA